MKNPLDDLIHELHDHGITAYRECIAPSAETIAIVAIFAPDRCTCDIEIGCHGRYLVKFRRRHGESSHQITHEELLHNIDLWNCNSEHGSIFKSIYQMMVKLRIDPIIKRNEVTHVINQYVLRDNDCLDIEIDDGYIIVGPAVKNRANGLIEPCYSFELADPKCFELLEAFLHRYKMADAIGDAMRELRECGI